MFHCVIIFYRQFSEAHLMKWKYIGFFRCIVTLYGQMAEACHLSWACICMLRMYLYAPFVVPPAPEIEQPVMQAQDFSNCRLTKSRKFLSLFRLLTSSPAPTLPLDSAKDSSPFLSLDRVPPLRGNKSPPAGEALLQPLTDDCVASGLGLLRGVNSIRGQNPLGLCLDVRLSGLYCRPDPPVLPTGSALRISTPLLEGSSTSASDYSRSCRVVHTDTRNPAICCVPVETRHKDCCRILFSHWSTLNKMRQVHYPIGPAWMSSQMTE